MATKMTREEAIKIVQSATVWTDEERDALSMLIPELAESEDERIRRWLCDYFSSIDKVWIHKDITCIDILRWLEKQKEQKKEKFPPYVTGFKGHPDPAGTSDLEEAAKKYASKTLCDPDDGPSTGLAKESFIAGAEWQKEQKPAEWSEEDENMAYFVNQFLEYHENADPTAKSCKKWFNNRLKFLKPSWKPNEEQMKALDIYRKVPLKYSIDREMLDSLYEQLKQL